MTPRGLGWRPERVAPAYPLDAGRLGLSLAPSSAYGLAELVAEVGVLDQGPTSTCVAQALAGAMRLRLLAEGRPAVLPSRRWLYRLSLERDGDPIVDGGTYVSTAAAVTRELGWCDERYAAWDEARVLEPMSPSARHHAFDQRSTVREHAISGDVAPSTRAALAAGYPIVFGATVDEAYLDHHGMTPVAFDGPKAGGHAQIAVGYDGAGVLVLNSWGPDWGEGGLACLSWRCWTTQCRDMRVIELVEGATS